MNVESLGLNWIFNENRQIRMLACFLHDYPERLIQNELLRLLTHRHAPVHHHNGLVLDLSTGLINFKFYIFEYLLNTIALEPFVLTS